MSYMFVHNQNNMHNYFHCSTQTYLCDKWTKPINLLSSSLTA
uniref:Uncharacterized protein n=1 Tax=Arundo donax TaxID=35708 RepID=A0A0A8YC77_ARUDO